MKILIITALSIIAQVGPQSCAAGPAAGWEPTCEVRIKDLWGVSRPGVDGATCGDVLGKEDWLALCCAGGAYYLPECIPPHGQSRFPAECSGPAAVPFCNAAANANYDGSTPPDGLVPTCVDKCPGVMDLCEVVDTRAVVIYSTY